MQVGRGGNLFLLVLAETLLWLAAGTGVSFCSSVVVWAQTADSQESGSDKSWTATPDSTENYANPTHTIPRHTQKRKRTRYLRSLQTQGNQGNPNPSSY